VFSSIQSFSTIPIHAILHTPFHFFVCANLNFWYLQIVDANYFFAVNGYCEHIVLYPATMSGCCRCVKSDATTLQFSISTRLSASAPSTCTITQYEVVQQNANNAISITVLYKHITFWLKILSTE